MVVRRSVADGLEGRQALLTEKVVAINRVAKVVKGGRRFSFSAVVVVGDGQGTVGAAIGKAREVPSAIRKAGENAKKHMVRVVLQGTTIPHDVVGVFSASRVLMRPASAGTGLIAGAGARAVLEVAGIRDVLAKSLGSRNSINVVQAVMAGLKMLRDPAQVRRARKGQVAGR